MTIRLIHPIEIYGQPISELTLRHNPQDGARLELLHKLQTRYLRSGLTGQMSFDAWLDSATIDVLAVTVEYAFGLPEGAGYQLHVADLEQVEPVVRDFFASYAAYRTAGKPS